jgi:hypothetical protein
MTKEEYKKTKIYYGAPIAIVLLLAIQLYSFIVGLHFGFNDWDWILGIGLFVTLFILQLIGNDLTWEDDWMFYLGWLFTYVVEITATTWTLYGILEFPNEYVRWIFSGGLAVIASVLPDRLIFLRMQNKVVRAKKVDTVSTHKPVQHKPEPSWMKSQKPSNTRPDNATRRVEFPKITKTTEPTYRPLNIPSHDRIGKPLWNDEGE